MNFNSSKYMNLLMICRKAGKLVSGFDAVKAAANTGMAAALFLTEDVSAKTRKEMLFFGEKNNIPVVQVPLPMEALRQATGRKAGVLAVCDAGFAKALINLCQSGVGK